ncbi:MAG: ChaN family lipoprotein [Zetaproteobacteria bacterium]|nr:ChaN family lipoprotein [Zetaproteobacteria bacterium]
MVETSSHLLWLEERMQRMVQDQLGPEPRTIKRYRENFEKDFLRIDKNLKQSSQTSIYSHHKVFLFGDFHSSASCQQEFTNFICQHADSKRQSGIGLECFSTNQQKWVDSFLVGAMTLPELFKKTNFHHNWGFPWPPIGKLLEKCRRKKLRVIALSPPWHTRKTLKERDTYFANEIKGFLTSYPESQVFALIGELHLAPSHLPAKLTNLSPRIFLHRQPPRSCEHIAAAGDVYQTKLPSSVIYTRSAPNWARWLSYLIWQELTHAYPLSKIETLHKHHSSDLGIEEPHHLFEDVLEEIILREQNPHLENNFSDVIQWLHKFFPEPIKKSSRCTISSIDPNCAIWVQHSGRSISCDMLNWRSLPLILAYLEHTCKNSTKSNFADKEREWTYKLSQKHLSKVA